MAILQITTTDPAGQVGDRPRRIPIKTNNTYEEVIAENFLQGAISMGNTFYPDDEIVLSYGSDSSTTQIFTLSFNGRNITLVPEAGVNSIFSFASFGPTGEDIFLTNPVATMNYIRFVFPALQVHLPDMNAFNSRQVGEKITFKNTDVIESMTIVDSAGGILAQGIKPGAYVVLTVIDTSTAEGAFDVELPLDAANDLSEVTQTGTHVTEWHGVWAESQSGNIEWSKIGNRVLLKFPQVIETGDNSIDLIEIDTLLPASLRPAGPLPTEFLRRVQLDGGSNQAVGLLLIQPTGSVSWASDVDNSDFPGSMLTTGFHQTEVEYDVA